MTTSARTYTTPWDTILRPILWIVSGVETLPLGAEAALDAGNGVFRLLEAPTA